MTPKSFVIQILLVGVVLLSMVGCGEDMEEPIVLAEEKTEESTVESSVSPLVNEELHGSWEVVSIFGKTPKEHLESFTVGGKTKITIKQLNYVFAADDSWTCHLEEITRMDFPNIPRATLEATGTWSGTYAFEGQALSMLTKELEVHIATEPKDFFQVAFDKSIAEAEQDYDKSFRFEFIIPFARSTCTKQGNTLVLIAATGEEMVLEKQ